MSLALLTDLYELNMAAVYLRRGMLAPATFSLFVRQLPPGRGFLVAAGLEDCLEFLEEFQFSDADLDYLRRDVGYPADTLAALRELRFTGDVWAVPEGRVVLANEPLLEVTAPLPEAQLVETVLLNLVTFATVIATKAVRCRLAAAGRGLVDFALRRTQSTAAGLQVARLSALAGFTATSNVEAGRRYGLPVAGTMAHSFVEAFGDEERAFAGFAAMFPAASTFLVDTYDTLTGVETAARVIRRLGMPATTGVRLDSGDLDSLSRAARDILDRAGLAQARVFASGGLDEYAIARLVAAGAPIDAFGVGTKMGVSADAPYLDSAYKLVEYARRPMLKTSPGKATMPGCKQVFRSSGPPDSADVRDLIGLRGEPGPAGGQPLLHPVLLAGRRTRPPEPLAAAQARLTADLAALPAGARAITDPVAPTAAYSAAAHRLRASAAVPVPAGARQPLPPRTDSADSPRHEVAANDGAARDEVQRGRRRPDAR